MQDDLPQVFIDYDNIKDIFKSTKRRELVKNPVTKYFSEEEAIDEILNMKYNKEVKAHVNKKKILKENNGKLYSLLWEKCTENMKAKIKYSTKYQNMEYD